MEFLVGTTHQGNGAESHSPLGVVAHGDGDPVALGDAVVVLQTGRQGVHLDEELVIGIAPALKYDEVTIAMAPAVLQDLDSSHRRVLVHLVSTVVDDEVF